MKSEDPHGAVGSELQFPVTSCGRDGYEGEVGEAQDKDFLWPFAQLAVDLTFMA